MKSLASVGLVAALAASASCYRERFEYECDAGEKGCRCNGGACLVGLECSEDHCVLPGCERGTAFCNCDDGSCDADLVCWEGGACVPADGSEGTAGVGGTSSGSTASSTQSTSMSTTGDTSTDPSDTSTDPSDTAECTPGTACGECSTCDDTGSCVADVGAPCDGPALACDEFLWGYELGACYRLVAMSLPATCDAAASCVMATPQQCPVEQGATHLECEPSCVINPGVCDTYDPRSTVTLEQMCELDGTTPDCTPSCHNRQGSNISNRACIQGQCNFLGSVTCDPYACENLQCNTECVDEFDCSGDYVCVMNECVII